MKQSFIIIIEGAAIFYLNYHEYSNNFIFYIINIFRASLLLISIIMSFIISKKCKYLRNYHKSFDGHNIIEQKKYENNRRKLIMIIEHYLYKCICDFILNLPSIIFHSNKKFVNIITNILNNNTKADENILFSSKFLYDSYYYLNMFFGFLYLYIFGIMLLNIDYNSEGYVETILNIFFCTKKYNFYFGNDKTNKNIKDLYNKNVIIDKSIYNSYFQNEFDTDMTKNIKDTFLDTYYGIDNSFNEEDEEDSEESKESSEDKNDKNILQYEYSPCNFYFIYKLLYLYFKLNKYFYLELEKNNDTNSSRIENNNDSTFKNENIENSRLISSVVSSLNDEEKIKRSKHNSFHRNKSKGKGSNINFRDYSDYNIREKIENINKISLSNKTKLIASKKYTLDELALSIEEQKMKKYFIKNIYPNLNQNYDNPIISNTFSTIKEKDESLFTSSVDFNIQNKIKSKKKNKNSEIEKDIYFIFKSLTNNTLFDINPYYNLTVKDIIKSLDITNNTELFYKFSEEKLKNPSYNYYYTKDALLSIEIYDEAFFNAKELKSFIESYKNYLIDKITNFSYSFLPLIIGIFNIKYLSYNKIVVLSRNPLSFSYNLNCNYWIKFSYFEKTEIEKSTDKKNIIDLSETEENIILENNEYKNSVQVLDNDLLFLQNTIKYNLNFKLNLFVLNDEYKNDLYFYGQSILGSVNPTLNDLNNNILDKIMRESITSFPFDEFKKYNCQKKYFGSYDICLLEKLYVNETVNNRYIFKIYFSDIFKKKIIDDEDKNKKNISISINEIDDNSISSSHSENREEKESIIASNNSKYCEFVKKKLIRIINKVSNPFDEVN
jgi:hypothetical protein